MVEVAAECCCKSFHKKWWETSQNTGIL